MKYQIEAAGIHGLDNYQCYMGAGKIVIHLAVIIMVRPLTFPNRTRKLQATSDLCFSGFPWLRM